MPRASRQPVSDNTLIPTSTGAPLDTKEVPEGEVAQLAYDAVLALQERVAEMERALADLREIAVQAKPQEVAGLDKARGALREIRQRLDRLEKAAPAAIALTASEVRAATAENPWATFRVLERWQAGIVICNAGQEFRGADVPYLHDWVSGGLKVALAHTAG